MTVSFSRPLRGLGHIMGWFPSAEALGYFHSSASPTLQQSPGPKSGSGAGLLESGHSFAGNLQSRGFSFQSRHIRKVSFSGYPGDC